MSGGDWREGAQAFLNRRRPPGSSVEAQAALCRDELRRAMDEIARLREELRTRAEFGRGVMQLAIARAGGGDEDEILDHMDGAWREMSQSGRQSFALRGFTDGVNDG